MDRALVAGAAGAARDSPSGTAVITRETMPSMRPCIVHAGMPKTGSTSIQSSLLLGMRDRRFLLITLDSFFGNRTVSAAFMEDPVRRPAVFFGTTDSDRPAVVRESARSHLRRALDTARRSHRTPILSAEVISMFNSRELIDLRDFLLERGFQPKVIRYLRPPLDFVESSLQQSIRIGNADAWEQAERHMQAAPFAAVIRRIDEVFGVGNVSHHVADPDAYPGRCVVRHFCQIAGIRFAEASVVRVNESLNDNSVRCLSALIHHGTGPGRGIMGMIRWESLVGLLRGIPGRPVRLHSSVTRRYAELIAPQLPEIEARLGRSLPLTTVRRSADEGLRSAADLLVFDDAAVQWIDRMAGSSPGPTGKRERTAQEIAEQLRRLPARHAAWIGPKLAREKMPVLVQRTLDLAWLRMAAGTAPRTHGRRLPE